MASMTCGSLGFPRLAAAIRSLPLIFAGALFAGWLRFRSGSIVGPWLVHATANVAVCQSVAARSGLAS
jgi:hypothetical protein